MMISRHLLRTALVIAASLALTKPGAAACQTQWLDLGGKGQSTCLSVNEGKSLSFYGSNVPSWDPCQYKDGRCIGANANKSTLVWTPLAPAEAAVATPVGTLSGVLVHRIVYDPTYEVFAWERDDGLLQPVLIISGDEHVIARIFPPELFRWHATDMLHARIRITGTGHLQVDVFLARLGPRIVALLPNHDETTTQLHRRGLQLFHKGGGFCQGSLTYAAAVEDEGPGTRRGGLLAQYAIRSGAVTLADMHVYLGNDHAPATKCETEP